MDNGYVIDTQFEIESVISAASLQFLRSQLKSLNCCPQDVGRGFPSRKPHETTAQKRLTNVRPTSKKDNLYIISVYKLSANDLATVLDDDTLVVIVHLNTAEVVCWCEIVVVASSSVDG